MTISAYMVESVLNAYNKQTEAGNSTHNKAGSPKKYTDVLTLSSEDNKKEAFDKISYGLLDILLKNK